MNGYKFRLANVARIRGLQEAIAKNELLLALRELKVARLELGKALEELSKAKSLDGEIYGAQAHWKFDQLQRLSDEILERQDTVRTSEHIAGEVRVKWEAASKRCETLARLDSRSRDLWRHNFALSEMKELDDISTARRSIGGGQ